MVVISKTIIRDFSKKQKDAEIALQKWYSEIKAANWKNSAEVKKAFNNVGSVGNDRYVFDIKGNYYRLIALIIFEIRTIFILFIGNHKEYDRINRGKVNFKKYTT